MTLDKGGLPTEYQLDGAHGCELDGAHGCEQKVSIYNSDPISCATSASCSAIKARNYFTVTVLFQALYGTPENGPDTPLTIPLYEHHGEDVPNLCLDAQIDGITTTQDGSTYIFKGQ